MHRLDQQPGPGRPWQPACQSSENETIGLPPVDNLHIAFQYPDLVARHQQLGLITGAVAEGCEVDEEPEAGVRTKRSMDGG